MKKYQQVILLAAVLSSMTTMSFFSFADTALHHQTRLSNSALSYVCAPISQENRNQLKDSCPIGEGLWGNQKPKLEKHNSEFWIQCGLFSRDIPKNTKQRLTNAIDASIYMKKEGQSQRCLIGPYQNFSSAQGELNKVKKLPSFKQSVLRIVDISSIPKQEPKPKSKPAVKPKPVSRIKETSKGISIRRRAIINSHEFIIPFVDRSGVYLYKEHGQTWMRVNAKQAFEVCKRIDRQLVSPQKWSELMDSNVIEYDKWPMSLPYWGENNQGLFKDQESKVMKETSMLNLICVKPVES